MPHFGMMDESRMSKEDAALMRSKLHFRSGRRQLRQNKTAAALATLYDALLAAMRWHILTTDLRKMITTNENEALENDRIVFSILKRAHILDGSFDIDRFQALVDTALMNENGLSAGYDEIMRPLDGIMTRLGVLPFDEGELPPEAPDAF